MAFSMAQKTSITGSHRTHFLLWLLFDWPLGGSGYGWSAEFRHPVGDADRSLPGNAKRACAFSELENWLKLNACCEQALIYDREKHNNPLHRTFDKSCFLVTPENTLHQMQLSKAFYFEYFTYTLLVSSGESHRVLGSLMRQ